VSAARGLVQCCRALAEVEQPPTERFSECCKRFSSVLQRFSGGRAAAYRDIRDRTACYDL
jgi:hypothetical protein